MDLKQLIEYLEKKDRDMIVPMGFDEPHSYRGDYMCLAFEPAKDVTIGAMLQCAKDAVGNIYQGWKGGEYRMDDDTEVYLAMYGCSGEKIGIVLLEYMTGVYEGEECKSLRGVISRSTDEIAGLIADRNNVRTDLASADSKLFEYRKQIVEQSKAIHDLTVEKDNMKHELTWANQEIPKLRDAVKVDRRRLVKERYELNRWCLIDRGTLRSIKQICVELEMRDSEKVITDVQAIKSMKRISNIMADWGPSTVVNEISKIERCNLETLNAGLRANMNEEKAQINRAIEVMNDTISEQNQTLLHIKAEIEFIKQHPFDLVLIDGSIENISNVIKDHKKSFINEECIECARLKKELDAKTEIIKEQSNTIEDLNSRCDSLEKDREFEHIISDSYRDDIEDLKDSIRGLEAELASAVMSLLDSSPMIFERDRIIENKIATINWLEARIDNQMKRLQSRSEEITSLKAKVDRLCGIIRSERAYNADHVYNADLLEGNKLKFHKIAVLEAELAALKADSEVLTKVVNVIRDWGEDEDECEIHRNNIGRIFDIVEDYINVPHIVVIK